MKIAKRIVAIIGIVSVLAFAALLVNYICGERMIDRYNKRIFESSTVNAYLGFTQPYIYHYNKGDIYYSQGDYKGAENEFENALKWETGMPEDCEMRINYALSIVKQIDPQTVTKDNLDEAIDRLEEAKTALLKNGCAHDEDENGHNSDAQTLKDEIDKFEEKLRQQVDESQPDDQDKNDDNKDKDKDSKKDSDEKKDDSTEADKNDQIKKQLQDIQNEGLEQRNQDMDSYEAYKDGYSFYDGQTW